LSPLLYVISIEVLVANLRAHPDIVGLRLPRSSGLLPAVSLYADDTSVIVSSDASIQAVFSTDARFERKPAPSSIFQNVRVSGLVPGKGGLMLLLRFNGRQER